ncbi:uroporphyrinogen decarboxylase family protein [Planctomycetota bacterium]
MNTETPIADGIHAMVPREQMSAGARKIRDTYAIVPDAPLYHKEFGYYCLERWYEQGLDPEADRSKEFHYDPPGIHDLGQLGWCEAAFMPAFEDKIIEDRGEHEVIQDFAGRHVLMFKGRRSGFMPEYLDHPVKDMQTWKENVKWRLDIEAPGRFDTLDERMATAREQAGKGLMICQGLIGGYMYLRSLIGPEALFYAFYDIPEVIHDCMQTWLELADDVIGRHQQHVTLDKIYFAEDICYNHGPLISIDMMKEFLFPYYQQVITNVLDRQIDKERHLYRAVDTDGYGVPVIDAYREAIGMDVMEPFEVASNNDVVEIGRQWPELVMSGGIDKRVLATTPEKIDAMVERILPVMRKRGGYIPTCDHGVPEEVSLENYRHYRKRCVELGE